MWDKKLVCELYGNDLCNQIFYLPLIKNGSTDRIVSFQAMNGCYTTKIRVLMVDFEEDGLWASSMLLEGNLEA